MIIKKSSKNNYEIKISKKDWTNIGKQTGWIKQSLEITPLNNSNEEEIIPPTVDPKEQHIYLKIKKTLQQNYPQLMGLFNRSVDRDIVYLINLFKKFILEDDLQAYTELKNTCNQEACYNWAKGKQYCKNQQCKQKHNK